MEVEDDGSTLGVDRVTRDRHRLLASSDIVSSAFEV